MILNLIIMPFLNYILFIFNYQSPVVKDPGLKRYNYHIVQLAYVKNLRY